MAAGAIVGSRIGNRLLGVVAVAVLIPGPSLILFGAPPKPGALNRVLGQSRGRGIGAMSCDG